MATAPRMRSTAPARRRKQISRPSDHEEQQARAVGQALGAAPIGATTAPNLHLAGLSARTPPTAAPPADTPPEIAQAISAPGEPLAPRLRGYFEQRLGADLGGVRLHHGAAAQQAATAVGARAFALGHHIAFGPGAYPLTGTTGLALLGHELAHTLQPAAHEVLRRDTGNAPTTPAPSPNTTPATPGAAPAAGALRWNGIIVSSDQAALRRQFEGLVEHGGLSELRRWAQGFLALDRQTLSAISRALSETDFGSLNSAVSETYLQLETDAQGFADELRPKATTVANAILDASRERIEAELEHYGIKQTEVAPAGGGGAEGAPAAYQTQITVEDGAAGQEAQKRARELAGTRRTADAAQQTLMKLIEGPGMSEIDKALRRQAPGLNTQLSGAEEGWKRAEDQYAKQAVAATQEFPLLAMYASGADAAARLAAFAAQPAEQLGQTIWGEASKRLANIETVRGELGGRFNPLFNQRIVDLTLGKEEMPAWQKRVGRDQVAAAKAKAEEDKEFWTVIAIGLGLIAAIPTGGASLAAAGIATAVGIAGAALSVYNAYEHWQEYQLQMAATATDFAKAEALAKDEPSLFWLAIDIIGAGLDLGAAAMAFKALGKVMKAAQAGDVAAALKVVQVTDSAGITGAAKNKIVGEAVAGLSEEAIEQTARTMAHSGGMRRQEYLARLMADLTEHTKFKGELQQTLALLEHVRGRIPETAREMIQSGRVQVFNEATLVKVYGSERGVKIWNDLSYADGFFDKGVDIIFLRTKGSTEDLAGALVHEATHRIGSANPMRGNDFMSEAIAEFAERDFYITLYSEGGPLAGQAPKSERIQQFLHWSDEQLMHDIEVRYFEAKKMLAPEKRVKFKNVANESPEEIVKSIFDDIAADYQKRLGGGGSPPTSNSPP